jgi:hypothetical protein
MQTHLLQSDEDMMSSDSMFVFVPQAYLDSLTVEDSPSMTMTRLAMDLFVALELSCLHVNRSTTDSFKLFTMGESCPALAFWRASGFKMWMHGPHVVAFECDE